MDTQDSFQPPRPCPRCGIPMDCHHHTIGQGDSQGTVPDIIAKNDGARFVWWHCKPCNHRETERLPDHEP